MAQQTFVFIGGSDAQNGDYRAFHGKVRNKKTASWASMKTARPGDRVLLYFQHPHSSIVGSARVIGEPVRGEPGDYLYRVKLADLSLVPNRLTLDELKERFPNWGWLRYPRGKALVPARIADKLWKLAHDGHVPLQILIANAGVGLSRLRDLTERGGTGWWSAPRLTRKGDALLFYIIRPESSVLARGVALTDAQPGDSKWWQVKVGHVELLEAPITLTELRRMFPKWDWLVHLTMFSYVPRDYAGPLLERANAASGTTEESERRGGAGFGDPETNRLVERAAVRKVTRALVDLGFAVTSRERDRVGYDLEATKRRETLHVEVKGISGSELAFPITAGEVNRASWDSAFRLFAVTNALSKGATIHEYDGPKLRRAFALEPIAYMARPSVAGARGTKR